MKNLILLLAIAVLAPSQSFGFQAGGFVGGGVTDFNDIGDLGCSDTEVIKWNNGTSTWECGVAAASDTNAGTLCAAGEYLDGDTSCIGNATQGELNTHSGTADDHHTATVDTNTNAATQCSPGEYYDGADSCADNATQAELGTHTGTAAAHHTATVDTTILGTFEAFTSTGYALIDAQALHQAGFDAYTSTAFIRLDDIDTSTDALRGDVDAKATILTATKAEDETIVASTTRQEDDDLKVTLLPDTTYHARITLLLNGSAAGGKASGFRISDDGIEFVMKANEENTIGYVIFRDTTTFVGGAVPDGADHSIEYSGVVWSGPNGGEFGLDTAQSVASGSLSVLRGSKMTLIVAP